MACARDKKQDRGVGTKEEEQKEEEEEEEEEKKKGFSDLDCS